MLFGRYWQRGSISIFNPQLIFTFNRLRSYNHDHSPEIPHDSTAVYKGVPAISVLRPEYVVRKGFPRTAEVAFEGNQSTGNRVVRIRGAAATPSDVLSCGVSRIQSYTAIKGPFFPRCISSSPLMQSLNPEPRTPNPGGERRAWRHHACWLTTGH